MTDYEAKFRERNARDVAKAYREPQYAVPVTCEPCRRGEGARACVRPCTCRHGSVGGRR